LLLEIDEEWQVGKRYFSAASMRPLGPPAVIASVAVTAAVA